MTKPKRAQRAPAKRAAIVPLGRPIDRLQPADREKIKADVAAFLDYVRRKRAEADVPQETTAVIRERRNYATTM